MELTSIAMEISAILAEAIIITYFFSEYFELKNNDFKILKYLLLFTLEMSVEVTNFFFQYSEIVMQTLFIMSSFIYLLIFTEGSKVEKLTVSLINFITIPFINLPILTIVKNITGSYISELIANNGLVRFEILFITKLLYFGAVKLYLSLRKNGKFDFKSIEWIFISISTIIILAIDLVMNYVMILNVQVISIAVVLLFVLEIFIAVMVMQLSKANKKINEIKIQNLQVELKNNEIKNLTERYNELNEIRHDINNYISNAISLIQSKHYDESLEYLEKIQTEKISNVNIYFKTNNEVIDAIINTKLTKAYENNIITQAWIADDVDFERNIVDVSNIISNLLDNAIENCSNENGKPEIIINIFKDGAVNVIKIENTVSDSVLENNPQFSTKKKNKDMHGIGLRSVKKSVNKIGGTIEINEIYNIFSVSITY
ncbi:MAG: GHKL domain-containing protein [Oscillospiraceae bacterium]|nr:GHKL domain-containing protein [Oscillospiraceae bacterium]